MEVSDPEKKAEKKSKKRRNKINISSWLVINFYLKINKVGILFSSKTNYFILKNATTVEYKIPPCIG